MFWIILFLHIKILSASMRGKILMSRYPVLEGRNITTSVIWNPTEPEITSRTNCAERCARKTECASFFHNSVTGHCQLHKDLHMTDDGSQVQDGVQYYYKMKGRHGWCPVGDGYQLLADDGPCVKFHTDRKTWMEAKETCASYSPYSRLVVLDTQEKNDLVKAEGMAINDHFSVGLAIGLSDRNQSGYRWMDGTAVTFTDWSQSDRSDPGGDNYVLLFRSDSWKWLRYSIGHLVHYICEITVDVRMYNKMMNLVN